jgi:CRP/FNR family cyclic AMP-dependent transcriptional regulator
MWGDEPQLENFRARLKLLLASHETDLNPKQIKAQEGDLLMQQGNKSDILYLLTEGSVGIELHQDNSCHRLTTIHAVDLIGEMGFFANGECSADVRVVDGPATLLAVEGHELLKAMLFDSDLVMEMLSLVCERCRRSNQVIGILLSGIEAAHCGDKQWFDQVSGEMRRLHHSIETAGQKLSELSPPNP